jgi:drug/metabolite transporter (DMT)-like permease
VDDSALDKLAAGLAGLGNLLDRGGVAIYFRLIQTLGSVGTTAQAYLRVPIGVLLSVVLLGESLTSTAWIGLACVVAGVAAMTIPQRKAAMA